MTSKPTAYLLAPLGGTGIFAGLYVAATLVYPGGSQADAQAPGFSWRHNYWCNLLNETAINGQPNPARPIAATAMLVLCLTLLLFWRAAPRWLPLSRRWQVATQTAGTLAIATAAGLLTPISHDLVTNAASMLAILATAGIFIGLSQLRQRWLFWLGCANLLLVALNNLCYYRPSLLTYLPVVQKITFVAFLFWVNAVAVVLHRLAKSQLTGS